MRGQAGQKTVKHKINYQNLIANDCIAACLAAIQSSNTILFLSIKK
jgi:hypothetical protein